MVEALYGELDGESAREFEAHLAGCVECARLLEDMRGTLALMRERRRPDPGTAYWDAYAERLEQRIAREGSQPVDASTLGRRRLVGSWGFRVAAAVLLLAAGAWIGRSVLAPEPRTIAEQSPANSHNADSALTPGGGNAPGGSNVASMPGDSAHPIDAPPGERPATHAEEKSPVHLASLPTTPARRYLERSQVLLITLLNADPGDSGYAEEVGLQSRRAGVLLAEGSAVRGSLSRDDRRMRELVDQLELILREISHLEASDDYESVDVIRNRLGREGVLLRINLEQMRESGAPGHGVPETKGALD